MLASLLEGAVVPIRLLHYGYLCMYDVHVRQVSSKQADTREMTGHDPGSLILSVSPTEANAGARAVNQDVQGLSHPRVQDQTGLACFQRCSLLRYYVRVRLQTAPESRKQVLPPTPTGMPVIRQQVCDKISIDQANLLGYRPGLSTRLSAERNSNHARALLVHGSILAPVS